VISPSRLTPNLASFFLVRIHSVIASVTGSLISVSWVEIKALDPWEGTAPKPKTMLFKDLSILTLIPSDLASEINDLFNFSINLKYISELKLGKIIWLLPNLETCSGLNRYSKHLLASTNETFLVNW